MRGMTLIAAGFLICSLPAQSTLEALAVKVEGEAAKEEIRLGLDTRIRAAERLRLVDPARALHILESGLPMLSRKLEPSYLVYRFMITYAFIDLDAAERAGGKIADKSWVYTALIERSATVKDYARVSRLVWRAEQEGEYSLGAIDFPLQKMKSDVPIEAVRLLLRQVAAFPTSRASDREVRTLLSNLAVFPEIDPESAREAAHKIFEAIDRPGFRKKDEDEELTATFSVRGKKIQTETTYDTVLLPSAAYLSVFDAEAYRAREASLPEWRSSLIGLLPSDLPAIVRAHTVLKQGLIARAAAASKPVVARPDYSKMSYDEALAAARTLEPSWRCGVLMILARRKALPAEQRRHAFEEIWTAAREVPLWERYNLMRQAFGEAVNSRIDGIFGPAALAWIETLDAAAKSDDPLLLNSQGRGDFHYAYVELAELFEQRDYALPRAHPSIAARAALRLLDRSAYEGVDFTLKSLDGKAFHLADLKGKVVMIDFWATWCPPCRDALPAIERIHQEWQDRGLVVLGIDDEPSQVIRSFLARNGITYPTLLDPDRKIHNLFGQDGNNQGIPLTVVFDKEGKFVDRVPYPHNEANLLAVLKKAGLV